MVKKFCTGVKDLGLSLSSPITSRAILGVNFIKAYSLIYKMRNVLCTLFEVYHIILRTESEESTMNLHFTKGNYKEQIWQVIPPVSSAGNIWSELGFSETADQLVYFMGGWKN